MIDEPSVRMLDNNKTDTNGTILPDPKTVGIRNNKTYKIMNWKLGQQVIIKCDPSIDENCPPK